MIKRLISTILLASFLFSPTVFALDKEVVLADYKDELDKIGVNEPELSEKVEQDGQTLQEGMEAAQYDVKVAFENLETRVKGLLKNDGRRNAAQDALDNAKEKVESFTDIAAQNEFDWQPSIGGGLPRLLPSTDFEVAQEEAQSAMNDVNRILIGPERPGEVPEGDLVNDFLPQIIRQLFRFAWVAVFLALTVSGVMLVLAKDSDERVTKAKEMIFYSIVGFVIIALAFAIVKAITDIDFFAFI